MRWRRHLCTARQRAWKAPTSWASTLPPTPVPYGSHYAIMDQYNVIVLAPQVSHLLQRDEADTDRLGITLLSPKGKQYIDLTKDPKGAVAGSRENLEGIRR